MLAWVENNTSITLRELKNKIQSEYNKNVTITTISNVLNGMMYTIESVHKEPILMNSSENKQKRAKYVEDLNAYIASGKQIIWIDETNYNLFCRKTRGCSRRGSRSILLMPTSRGPNMHLTGVLMKRKRGSFETQDAIELWIGGWKPVTD